MHTSCDLCGDGMIANQKSVVCKSLLLSTTNVQSISNLNSSVTGNRDSTCYHAGIIVPCYPAGSHGASSRVAVAKWRLCRAAICMDCNTSTEAATLHPDCLQLFMRSCASRDALDRLWLAATWQDTLPGIQHLRLPKNSASFSATFAMAVEKFNLPQVKMLPREILDPIQELCEPQLFYRYIVVQEIARRLSSGPSGPLETVTMSQISSWKRGSSPKFVGEVNASSSIIRCVFDFLGLKVIERLTERPSFERGRPGDMAFIVEEEDAFRNSVIQFKVPVFLIRSAFMI